MNHCAGGVKFLYRQRQDVQDSLGSRELATLEELILIVIGTSQTWSAEHVPRATCLVIHTAPNCAPALR